MFNVLIASVLFSLTTSKEALRFQYSHEQGFDTSCGLSVAASLLDRYWDIPTSELELLALGVVERAEGDDYTVNLADMAKAFAAYELASRAYQADWDSLVQMVERGFAPLVVHYDRPVRHFALLLGFVGQSVILADPASGLEVLSREQFLARYSGAAMAVASRQQSVNTGMVAAAIDWAVQRQLQLESAALEVGLRW